MKTFLLDTRLCMQDLLLKPSFDSFLFIEGDIITFNKFHIDGRLHKEYFRQSAVQDFDAPGREHSLWKEVRGFFLSLIRGRRTPLSFHIILSLSAPNIEKLLLQDALPFTLKDVQGLYLNLRYNGTELTCTTGTSMHLFTMDKSLEHSWDELAQKFFIRHNLLNQVL